MKKGIKNFNINNKTIILRCDLNVPIKDNKILDDNRIVSSVETIKYILDNNAKVVILSHLGKVKTEEDKLNNSLEIVYQRLNSLLDNKIKFINKTCDQSIKEEIDNLDYGYGIMLENTRFEDLNGNKESGNDPELAKYWASLGDIFINDAFGTLHRAHASTVGISNYLETGIGFLVEKEIKELNKLDHPKKPFVVIMGGSKVSDKINVISSLIKKVDYLLIGGGMAFTFLKARGYETGNSLVEDDYLEYCRKLLTIYSNKIILPLTIKGGVEFSNDIELEAYAINDIPENFVGMDIGYETVDLFKEYLEDAKTVFWNGPLGVYEFSNYQNGTKMVMEYISENINTTILGGGDLVGCANTFGYGDKLTFLSTGGGASLEYLENKDLPGLKNIKEV